MLKQMILEDCENNRGLAQELAKVAGYSSGSGLKKMLSKDDNGDCEKVDGLLKLAKYRYPEKFDELLLEYAKKLNHNRITARLLLEYVSLHHKYEVKNYLTKQMKESKSIESQEWAHVYDIDDRFVKKEIGKLEGIKLLNERNYTTPEMNVFSKIVLLYFYYEIQNDFMFNVKLDEIKESIQLIKNDFIRNAYIARFFNMQVGINLHNGKLGDVLENLFTIENSPDPLKSIIYLQIGNSYIIKSYEKSIEYLQKALNCNNKRIEEHLKQSINFVSLLWGKIENYKYDGTLSNDLFYNVKIGNKRQAEYLLSVIDFDSLSTSGKAFNCYYRGLLYNNVNWFCKSIKYFNDCNDKFYKQLPLIELKNLKVEDCYLEAMGF